MNPSSVTIPLALMGGLISFVSPCVLPLVPAYIGYLTGQATNTVSNTLAANTGDGQAIIETKPSRWVITLHGVFFVLGFTLLFVLLGFGVGALGQFSRNLNAASDWISRIGGVLIIILALHVMGVIRIPFLYYDTRNQMQPKSELGYFGSTIMGFTFAAGWSPCVGPILGAVLGLGYTTGSVGQAAVLLTFYSLGLGIPFLLTALLLDQMTGLLRKLQRHMRTIEIVSGLLLLVIGVLMLFGQLQMLSGQFAASSDISILLEDWLLRMTGN